MKHNILINTITEYKILQIYERQICILLIAHLILQILYSTANCAFLVLYRDFLPYISMHGYK